jgi:hypothetical protein
MRAGLLLKKEHIFVFCELIFLYLTVTLNQSSRTSYAFTSWSLLLSAVTLVSIPSRERDPYKTPHQEGRCDDSSNLSMSPNLPPSAVSAVTAAPVQSTLTSNP